MHCQNGERFQRRYKTWRSAQTPSRSFSWRPADSNFRQSQNECVACCNKPWKWVWNKHQVWTKHICECTIDQHLVKLPLLFQMFPKSFCEAKTIQRFEGRRFVMHSICSHEKLRVMSWLTCWTCASKISFDKQSPNPRIRNQQLAQEAQISNRFYIFFYASGGGLLGSWLSQEKLKEKWPRRQWSWP